MGRTFDEWALDGRSERMEAEHGKSVMKLLRSVPFERPFSFLDIGCGNGWVVRAVSGLEKCTRAVGIDKSKNMIKIARSKSRSKKELYVETGIESWGYGGTFDYAFAMESIYYSDSVQKSVAKVFRMLNDGGEFFCGTDFYRDNKATSDWPEMTGLRMHLLSRAEWKMALAGAGFQTRSVQIRDPASSKKWRRDFGTLFVIGLKC